MLGVLPNREIEPMLRFDPIGNLQALFACQKSAWRLSVVWVDDKKGIVTGAMIETDPDRLKLCSILAQDEIALRGLFTQISQSKYFILPKWAAPIAQKSFPTAKLDYDLVNVCTKFDFQPKAMEHMEHNVIRLTDKLIDQLAKDTYVRQELKEDKTDLSDSTVSNCYGSVKDDQIVSLAKCKWATDLAVSVGNVYTLPKYRNEGHATAVVRAATKDVLAEGKMAVYFCSKDNMASLNICKSLGYWFYKSHGFMQIK